MEVKTVQTVLNKYVVVDFDVRGQEGWAASLEEAFFMDYY